MKAIEFEGVTHKIAEFQPQYQTLPAKRCNDGSMIFCFELDEEEIKELVKTKRIFWKQFTGDQPMQPIGMSTLRSRLSEPV